MKNSFYNTFFSFVIISLLNISLCSADIWTWGRNFEENRDKTVAIKAGRVSNMNIGVQETRRKLYDITGSYWKQDDAENYNMNDFGMTDNYPSFGLFFKNEGRFFTFQFDSTIMNPSANPVARRNYYIEVGEEIEFEGQKYNQMKIPSNTEFNVEMLGGDIELHALFTPFTLEPIESFRITPWVDLGIFAFAGNYKLDAGEPTAVVQYQNPPEDFVVGGKSGGSMGIALPEWGGGGEIRLLLLGGTDLVIQGSLTECMLKGSTKTLTTNKHREKNVDIDHKNFRGRVMFEIPLSSKFLISIGIQYQSIESEAMITAKAETPEEILATQERFDKNVKFRMEALSAIAGFIF